MLVADGQELTAYDDLTRRRIRQVLAAVADYNKTVTVLKLRAARHRIRTRTGRCEGRKPFGDRPGEHATIELMNQLRRKGAHPDGRAVAGTPLPQPFSLITACNPAVRPSASMKLATDWYMCHLT